MGAFQNLSIKWKLQLIIILAAGTAVLFASVAFLGRNFISSHQKIRNDLYSLSQIIGNNSVGAIVFNDKKTAENNLLGLDAKPYVFLACIYDRNNEVFAIYKRKDAQQTHAPQVKVEGHYYEDNFLFMFKSIKNEGEAIGRICIQYDLKGIQSEMYQSAAIFGIIVSVAFALTLLLSTLLQRIISRPVLDLTQTARSVSEKKDFSVRAVKHANDEIGMLIDVFNDMLAAIQSRDDTLKEYREHLEDQVAKRTAALRKVNQQLRDAKETAESANRAKSEFLANMSHEIRTPMNAVLGFTELLSSQITDQRQKSYLDSISSSGKSLLILINGILDLSKIEAGKMELVCEPVNLKAILNEIKGIFSLKAIEKNLEFRIQLSDDLPDYPLLDEVRLRQILFNLIGNAVKFTEKGYVELEIINRTSAENEDSNDCQDLTIKVKDTGIGIPDEFHDEIFKAFHQKDTRITKRFGGTGLGLSITKRLIEMMGGTIRIDSKENEGSCFTIVIPNVAFASAIPPAKKEHFIHDDIAFSQATVLIVDDIESNRTLIREFLRQTQLSFLEAENGASAIQLAQANIPDIIFMDLKMPVMDGVTALKELRHNPDTESIPVIALTALGMKEDKKRILNEGFDGLLTKPIHKKVLFDELTRFIEYSESTNVEQAAEQQEEMLLDTVTLNRDVLSKVIGELEHRFMADWEAVKKNLFFDDIEAFAKQMTEFGKIHSVDRITHYGTELSAAVQSFDVEKVNITLNAYLQMIENLKSIYNQNEKG